MSSIALLLWLMSIVCLTASEIALPPNCRDPFASPSTDDPSFLVFTSGYGSGVGNVMEFFPSAFYIAAWSGRFIVIDDDSSLGDFCKIITCGYPLVSEMAQIYPDILSPSNIAMASHVNGVNGFKHAVTGQTPLTNKVIRAQGYKHSSEWYLYHNETLACVDSITKCTQKHWTKMFCADYYAIKTLIRGPFKSTILEKEEHNVFGAPPLFIHSLLSLPHMYAPRVDISVHMRNQFDHFEGQDNIDSTAYRAEVANWLNSSAGINVFNNMESKILEEMKLNGVVPGKPFIIYVAGDNEEVKDALIARLERKLNIESTLVAHGGQRTLADSVNSNNIHIMHLNSDKIVHLKFGLEKKLAVENRRGLLDMAFDWYAMSLSKKAISYRRDGTTIRSSFVESAQFLSRSVSYCLEMKRNVMKWVQKSKHTIEDS